MNGATHAAAAEAAGVTRETVSRWVSEHPATRSAIDVYRSVLATEQFDTVQTVRQRALDIVVARLDGASLAEALAVLRTLPAPAAPSSVSALTADEVLDVGTRRTLDAMPEAEPTGGLFLDVVNELTGTTRAAERERAERITMRRLGAAAGFV